MRKIYHVRLFGEERGYLEELVRVGKAAARTLMHARILLKADEGPGGPAWSDDQIIDALEVSRSTVERVRTRCVEEGPDAALRPRPSPTPPLRKLDGAQEARLIAVACSPPPEGRKRWTLPLLADKVVELEIGGCPRARGIWGDPGLIVKQSSGWMQVRRSVSGVRVGV